MNENPNSAANPTDSVSNDSQPEMVSSGTPALEPELRLSAEEQQLFGKIPTDGSNVGNTSLRRELGWDDEEYWAIRRGLLDKGVLSLTRGRGGGVRRVVQPTIQSAAAKMTSLSDQGSMGGATAIVSRTKEGDFYEAAAETLRDEWAPDLGFENFVVEIIAWQGRRPTGGAWTRPDIVLVNVANYRYVPGRYLDVITFELKLAADTNVKAVYEALAHRRTGTRAYLMIVGGGDVNADELEALNKEAGRQGVGVIEARDVDDLDSWRFHVEPQRIDADPSDLDEFIDTQLSQETKRKISLWVK